jgi:hypothetical protein
VAVDDELAVLAVVKDHLVLLWWSDGSPGSGSLTVIFFTTVSLLA